MRGFASSLMALILVACGPPADKPAEDVMGEAPGGAETGLMLSDLAGTWDMRSTPEGKDTVITFQMVATGSPDGWALHFPGRDPIPLRVTAAGDSVLSEAGPFESVIRKGVQVSTRSVFKLENGKLMGRTTASYEGGGADSVLQLHIEGTRAH